ncbi:arsenate reductase (glutaredoxin) [Aestuariibaculum sp. YM273]|uniref:arsenate reductase (glutaredoxin) n=1 Tax=Aestuariibaculum sp. YM273 TaxID=3070659 RepID=UPI0027DB2337|nr:arsenate reductase (glutaredoxin) [Aestuariibaculum sp. YM273]WMI64716.1 arsenate reductase (glutaredoxin) [Aestuariibaculum sp. YM273]
MIKIYHNNRCSKSRLGVQFLEDAGKDFEIVKYLENVPTEAELTEIIKLLGITPMELVRKNEAVWKSDYKGKDLSDSQIIKAMVENPKLIERPIVINGDKGVVGRPTEKIAEIF